MPVKYLIAATCLFLTSHVMAEQKPPAVSSSVLLKSSASWDGTPYKAYPEGQPELTVLQINIPAETSLNWHTHPIPNAAYVVSGELTVETRDSGERIHLKKGDTLPEMVDSVHRGKTGKVPVELIVFYAGARDIPVSQPVTK
ncbi:cupin [Pseudomonas floridensis]|uniref:Cupin n=1 Tax=Pseudomonas floridensis TaxID=1958950 RepID=A0A1X0N8Z4_9PSED|nr:cupin domain-containing protein [Pseudomonas floridensis]ORC59532.1 cupin [Pseudomonas floridensis]